IITDVNNDKFLDTIFFSSSLTDSSSFNKIEIAIKGFSRKTFFAKHAWSNVDSTFLIKNKNAVNSKTFFLAKEKDHSIILLFGYLYETGREDFAISNIKDNRPKMVFDKGDSDVNIEVPIKLAD